MARGGALNLLGGACSQASLFGITVLIGHTLGRGSLGRYAQSFALLSLLGLLSLSGLRAGLTRYVARHLVTGDHTALRTTVIAGTALTAAVASLLAAAWYFTAPWLSVHAFHDSALLFPLRIAALTLPASAFTDAALAATQGFRTMRPFALISLIFEPLLRLGLAAAAISLGLGLHGVMLGQLTSMGLAAVLAAASLARLVSRAPASPMGRADRGLRPATDHVRELFRFSLVSWAASVAATGLIWADTVLLGIFSTSAQVGTYTVATRLVTLATFVMMPINAAFQPRIADLHARGDLASLKRTYAVATGWILRLSMPAFVAVIVFPGDLLHLFGRGFQLGAIATVIFALGKLVDAGTGPCSLMLTMTGRPVYNMVDNVGVLILNVGLNIALIPRFGIVGSAAAWAIALWIVNSARVLQVWRGMRMLPFDGTVLRAAIAGASALLLGFAVRYTVMPAIRLPFGLFVVAITYGVVTVVINGVAKEDKIVFREVIARRRAASRHAAEPAAEVTVPVQSLASSPDP